MTAAALGLLAAAAGGAAVLVAGSIYHRDRLRGTTRPHTAPPLNVTLLARDPRPYDWQRDR